MFKIKKNKHSSGFHFGFTCKNKVEFKASFTDSCLYHFGDADDYDINKLFGISTTIFHHIQSARIGWRCVDGETIEIFSYSYNDGVRKNEEHDILGIVNPNQEFECSIEDKETEYEFKFRLIGDKEWSFATDKKQPDKLKFHYYLWPYFGGNKVAPQDMIINLQIKK